LNCAGYKAQSWGESSAQTPHKTESSSRPVCPRLEIAFSMIPLHNLFLIVREINNRGVAEVTSIDMAKVSIGEDGTIYPLRRPLDCSTNIALDFCRSTFFFTLAAACFHASQVFLLVAQGGRPWKWLASQPASYQAPHDYSFLLRNSRAQPTNLIADCSSYLRYCDWIPNCINTKHWSHGLSTLLY